MFWNKGEGCISETFLLTNSIQTQDPWLQEVLRAHRRGEETWEIYCFMHGLPIRNTGSWLPSTGVPMCGSDRCLKLGTEVWPEMWRRDRGHGWARRS